VAVAAAPADALDAGDIQLPVWTKVLGWCGTAGLIYLLICERRHDRHGHPGRAHLRRQPHRIPQSAGRLNNPRLLQLARAADLFPHRADLAPSGTTQRRPDQRAVGTGWLPEPARFDFVRDATDPVVNAVDKATTHLNATLGPLFTIVIGAALILVVVHYLGKLLKLLMVGKARDILTKAVTRNAYLAMASGMGVTALTQSSAITTSVLVPFAGAGILTPAQIYPVTVGANLGTTFTVVFAAFAVAGPDAKIGLQAAFVHLLYNLFAIIVIYVIPVLRPVPLFCAQTLARIVSEHKWVIAVYLITVFIALPALVIIGVGVL
jgi:Na+/Pi-cotransporter